MKVQRFNKYNQQWYEYEVPDDQLSSSFFSQEVHTVDPPPIQPLCRAMCAYCGYSFESRNKLFYHLGFHGIDVRGNDMDQEESRKRSRKRMRRHWWKSRKQEQKRKKEKKKQRTMDVSNMFQTLHIE